jgi:hypothetical protein
VKAKRMISVFHLNHRPEAFEQGAGVAAVGSDIHMIRISLNLRVQCFVRPAISRKLGHDSLGKTVGFSQDTFG